MGINPEGPWYGKDQANKRQLNCLGMFQKNICMIL